MEFEAVDDFKPTKSKRGSTNPYVEMVAGVETGVWFKVPANLTEAERDAVVAKLRAAGTYNELSIKVRFTDNDEYDPPAASQIAGWMVTGPIKHREKKENGADATS